ncbi:MAG TPA: hypothetical protein VLG76_03045 [Rhabdochlamydiaceae bacterium]|nr:hypothetical protein [Rhabdochlamydiaceae bacterium]
MRAFTVFIVIIILALVFFFIFWSKVPEMISNNLSKKLQVQVSIGDMRLTPTSVKIDKFQIGNPSGYTSLPKAFSSDTMIITAPLTEYFKKDIVIEEVELDGIYLGLEFDSINGTDGNWTVIMSRFENTTEKEKNEKAGQKTVLIKKLVFTNISTYLVFTKDGGIKKLPKIDRMEFYNVSSYGGFPIDQLLNSVLGKMLRSVFEKEHLKNMLKEILKDPKGTIDNTLKFFKGLFQVYSKEIDVA